MYRYIYAIMSGPSSRLTEWSQSFEVTRRKIDVKRKANEPFSATETRAFNAALSSLGMHIYLGKLVYQSINQSINESMSCAQI